MVVPAVALYTPSNALSVPAIEPPHRSVSLVIPAKNEAQNIGWVLERVPKWIDEIVVVDGLSTDDTLAVAKRADSRVMVVEERRPGKGAAVRAGFSAARGDYVVMIDADGSMDPGEIASFVERLDAGADLVKGSRFMVGGSTTDMTPIRWMGNFGLLTLTNALYGSGFSELCYGFMALRREAIAQLQLDADGFEIETQIVTRAARAKLVVVEVPSVESPRRYGDSNLNATRDGLRILRVVLSERLAGVVPSGPRPRGDTAAQSASAEGGYGQSMHRPTTLIPVAMDVRERSRRTVGAVHKRPLSAVGTSAPVHPRPYLAGRGLP